MKRIISLLSVVLWLAGAAGAVLADDIDIYGTTTVSVQPNVLIIFDNSGSMSTEDVGGEFYDPDTTYTGSKLTNAVYRRTGSGTRWSPYVYTTVYINNVDNLLCASVKDDLKTKGYADGVRLRSDTRCGTSSSTRYWLRLGNFINYEASDPDDPVSRISVAKQVITNLINDTDNVRLGLMAFNYEQGGYVRKAIGSTKSELVTSVNALTASTWTPLAETLAEAGLYFAGKSSWYNSGTYTSPIQYRCQKNYIILMTDGEPTHDVDWRLATGAYINGDTIGDQDGDGHEPGGANAISYDSSGSDYLDDVAKYLHDNDLRQGAGTNPTEDFDATDFPTQNITGIFTIGFKTAQALLQETAANGNGEYYTADSASGLAAAFESIMSSIVEANAVFVAPVVPVSRTSRTYSGDKIYIGFFHPESDGRWLGNIKKYSLNSDGNIVDVNDNVATDDNGAIVDSAQSYWSASADGADVLAGGLGALLKAQASRNLYTYLETNTALTHADNAFTAGNTALTAALLGVSSDERAAVIADVTNGSETKIGAGYHWKLGDILHSEPAVVHYDSTTSMIFAGSNNGVLHCFNDSTGAELWGFIPPDQLGKLKNLSDTVTSHDYFVDGTPKVYSSASEKILFFGQRRGGDTYHAINVQSYTSPVWKYSIGSTFLGGETLGQSWGTPAFVKIKTASGIQDAVLLPGGYDTNQDLDTPAANDSVGRAVFAVNVSDGTLISNINFNHSNYSAMTHSIVDVSGLDTNADGMINRIYAPDMYGQIFAFEDDDKDGTWSQRRLFSASAADSVHRKIFYAPDSVLTSTNSVPMADMIFFGTGDRANPTDTTVANRFYAVENDWDDDTHDLDEDDLYDATDNLIQMGTEAQKVDAQTGLDDAHGWFIELEDSGEKAVSSAIVYNGVIYFTTYTPTSDTTSGDDPCAVCGDRGIARLYALNYLTGGAVMDFSSDVETDGSGNTVPLGKKDRSKIVGTSIPSAPVIAITPTGARLYLGIEGGVIEQDVLTKVDIHMYFWREISR